MRANESLQDLFLRSYITLNCRQFFIVIGFYTLLANWIDREKLVVLKLNVLDPPFSSNS